jgi:AraC-like DNA-binding protein
MPATKNEYEVVDYTSLKDVKVFVVDIAYRTPHMHKEFELCLVLSGSVRVSSRQDIWTFAAGSFFLVNTHQVHEIQALDGAAQIVSLQVSPKCFERFFPQIGLVEFDHVDIDRCLPGEEGITLRARMLALALAYFGKGPCYEFACHALVCELFRLLMTLVPWHFITEREKSKKIVRSDRIDRIVSYVEEHFTEKVLLADLVEREQLTLSYLSHFFKDNLNMSFQRFVALLRFDEARRLVERTDMNITDVCLTCGFSDYRYLNKIFLEKLGCTPAQYRTRSKPSGRLLEDEDKRSRQRFYPESLSIEILKRAMG